MATDRVVIIVDWSQAEASPDATEFVRSTCLSELKMGRGYTGTEIAEVARDPTFQRSSHEAAIRMHNRETSRKERVLKGKDGTPERIVDHVSVAYTRPVSRGMWNRERDAMRE